MSNYSLGDDWASFYRETIVAMLNILGDWSKPCPGGSKCVGCEADASAAMEEGLSALGYDTWQDFHDQEILRS